LMSRSFSRGFATVAISFIVGLLCSPIAIGIWKGRYVLPVQCQQRRDAHAFFYRTMIELLSDTYDPKEGFVRQDALDNYKKYVDQLGGMCFVRLDEDSGGCFDGLAFFPSGDVFEVGVQRIAGSWHLTLFQPWNWERLWAGTLDRYDVHDTKQHSEGERQ